VAEAKQINAELAQEFRRILKSHQGSSPVQLRLRSPGGGSKMFAFHDYPVDPSPSFLSEVKGLLGRACIE
jgi:hypothetical protein